MFKIKTLKGRKWFFAYTLLITLVFLFLLLFGSLYSTILAEKQKISYLKTSDIGSKGTDNPNSPDFLYVMPFDNLSMSDVQNYDIFFSNLANFSMEKHIRKVD